MTASVPAAAVALFAKAPSVGAVKTRLTPPLTPEEAAAVARALLRETVARFGADPDLPLTLFLDGALDEELAAWVAARRLPLRPQADGNLGTRLRAGFTELFERAPRVIAIGADSPTLPLERLRQAATALERHDAVVGPAEDGGYYLIGLGRPEWRLLEGIPWSSSSVTRATLARAAAVGASVARLMPWYDVDDVAGLRRALADSPAGSELTSSLRGIAEKLAGVEIPFLGMGPP